MKESITEIKRIACNLSCEEFSGYCKAMSLHWTFKILDDPKRNPTAYKRVKFWDGAYESYLEHCGG